MHQRGFFDSRTRAQAAVMAGEVYVDGGLVDKPGTRMKPDCKIDIRPRGSKFVSRGGLKLEGALEDLKVPVKGKVVLDVGASTGGFTDCLLKNGAGKVYALDVGYGLIDQKLRDDPRVVVMEKVNIRNARKDMFNESPQLAVVDVSFISLKLVLPVLKSLDIESVLTLVKPQFEAGRAEASRGKGVIRDARTRSRTVKNIAVIAEAVGYRILGESKSILTGPKGNVEIFLYMKV